MDLDRDIFREYDIRGDVRTQLTPEVARLVGEALGVTHFAPGSRVTIGRDARNHSAALAGSLAAGLTGRGVDVVDIGMVTTPMMYYALHSRGFDGGIMVTGSHNPINDNGLKMCRRHESFVRRDIEAVYAAAASAASGGLLPEYTGMRGGIVCEDVSGGYAAEILARVRPARRLKIAVDAGNGSAGPAAGMIFGHYASKIDCLFCDPDGAFPNHHPDPSVPANLVALRHKVLETGADVGLAFDGDGDRLGVVDRDGSIVPADRLIVLFAREILARRPGGLILGDVKCSKLTFDDIRSHGGRADMTRTGHALIKAGMAESGALMAGEMSGHFFFGDRWFGFDDAIYAGARLVEILASARPGTSVGDLLADMPASHATPEIRLDCPDGLKFRVAAGMCDLYEGRYHVCRLDGARIDFEHGWALVRASNTQPVLVVRVEADTGRHMEQIRERVFDDIRGFGVDV